MTAHISLHVDKESDVHVESDAVVIKEMNGTYDYEDLENKPLIDGTTLIGDKSLEDLGITPDGIGVSRITNQELEELLT